MGKDLSGGGGGSNSKSRRRSRSSSGCDRSDGSSSSTTSTGCINAFFQLFHLHHYFHFPLNSSSSSTNSNFSHSKPPIHHLQGVVAPRNSLEMEETNFMEASSGVLSSSSTIQNQKSLQLPMSGMQIKTIGSKTTADDQDLCSPAATKTPTLVARLMGLDLLPETSSPRPSSSSSTLSSSKYSHSQHQLLLNRQKSNNKNRVSSCSKNDATTGTRSLPDTPRTSSSSSARRSDVDQRFSLQMNKENSQLPCNEFEFSKFLTAKIAAATARRKEDENMSPGHYAKQIVKQFKESVSRRVGRDITNTSTVIENGTEHRRDQHVVLLKSKKPTLEIYQDSHSQIIAPPSNSSSPRLRFLEIKNKLSTSDHSPKLSSSPLSDNQSKKVLSSSQATQAVAVSEKKQDQQISSKKGKKIAIGEKYGARIKKRPQTSDLIRSKQEESFVMSASTSSRTKSSQHVDRKCKKSTPLSNVPTILTVKKDHSPPATRLPQEEQKQHQSSLPQLTNSSKNGKQLSSCLNQFIQKPTHVVSHLTAGCNNSNSTTTAAGELSEYISRILKCTGIGEYTTVSFTNWYSPSHPLNPSIFPLLKLSQAKLGQCKLVFDVADEILADILKPYLNSKPWNAKTQRHSWQLLYGRQLIDTLCRKIRSLPAANCRVLDDIDRIIDKDLGGNWEDSTFDEEIGDEIVGEVEGDILDGLMHEMVLDMGILVSVG